MRQSVALLVKELKNQLTIPQPVTVAGQNNTTTVAATVNQTSVVNNIQVMQTITITPWDGGRCISVDAADVAAAFAGSARLQSYAKMDVHIQSDSKVAPPYVIEMLTTLVKQRHADPTARNVYMNPRRADQVLALMSSGRWEVLPLVDATRLLLGGVARRLFELGCEPGDQVLPFEERAAAAMLHLMYLEGPEKFAQLTKGTLVSHLSNTAPAGGAQVAVGAPLPAPAPTCAPKRAAGKPLPEPPRWTVVDAADQVARAPRRAGEPLRAWADRLIEAAGVEDSRWCNKLWEALDEKLVPAAHHDAAAALLAAAELGE